MENNEKKITNEQIEKIAELKVDIDDLQNKINDTIKECDDIINSQV